MLKVRDSNKYIGNAYRFNDGLWKDLPKFLCTTNNAIYETIGIPRQTYVRWRNNGVITMKALVTLCNTFNMRLSWFITPKNVDYNVPCRHSIMQLPFHFEFNKDFISKYIGQEMSWREASELTGHNRETLQSWCGENATVYQFLFILNTFRIPITETISDNTLTDILCSDMQLRKELIEKQNEINRLMNIIRDRN